MFLLSLPDYTLFSEICQERLNRVNLNFSELLRINYSSTLS
jgi:hypothetical protein